GLERPGRRPPAVGEPQAVGRPPARRRHRVDDLGVLDGPVAGDLDGDAAAGVARARARAALRLRVGGTGRLGLVPEAVERLVDLEQADVDALEGVADELGEGQRVGGARRDAGLAGAAEARRELVLDQLAAVGLEPLLLGAQALDATGQ